jgi:phosphatidate phosphatase APP1
MPKIKVIIMKNFLILLTVVFSFQALSLTVVTDLDDTLKITNVDSPTRAVWNALFSKKAFKGMPKLIQTMDGYVSGVYILSASPTLIGGRIKAFLKKNEIEAKSIFTRSLTQLGDVEKYKYNVLNTVATNQNEKMILIGDNVQVDEKIYLKYQNENVDSVEQIYIHKVKNLVSDAKVIQFYTAFDIAVNETLQERMSFTEVSVIAKDLLLTKDMSKYIPNFAYCPTDKSEFNSVPFGVLSVLTTTVRTKIINYCIKRASLNARLK